MENEYARNIMLKIAIMEDVVQVKVLDLKIIHISDDVEESRKTLEVLNRY